MNDIEGLITATPEADSRNQSLDKILEETSSEPVKPELMEAALDEANSLNETVDKIEKSPEATMTTKITEKSQQQQEKPKTTTTSSEKVESKKEQNNSAEPKKQNDEKSSSGDKNVAADITKELANATQKSK